MAKLVVCKGKHYAGDCKRALEAVRIATPRGYKKDWRNNIPGGYRMSCEMESRHQKKYAFLIWNGSDEQYLITRLTESTGIIVAQVDIDLNNNEWYNIERNQHKYWVHYHDKDRITFHEMLRNKDSENIYNSYMTFLDSVKKDLL